MARMDPREIERRLGFAYAQTVKESGAVSTNVYKDCQEVIQSSLAVMEHYNKIAMGMKGAFNKGKQFLKPQYKTAAY